MAGFHKDAYSAKRVKNGKSDESRPAQPPISCPTCGSTRTWKDGLRYAGSKPTQRYLCRDCGYRFSQPKSNKPGRRTLMRQVCALEAKNLAGVESREKRVAGATTDLKSLLFNFAWWLKKNGYAESTIQSQVKHLRTLARRGADLYDPESVKDVIARQNWSSSTRLNAVHAYTNFLTYNKGRMESSKLQANL